LKICFKPEPGIWKTVSGDKKSFRGKTEAEKAPGKSAGLHFVETDRVVIRLPLKPGNLSVQAITLFWKTIY